MRLKAKVRYPFDLSLFWDQDNKSSIDTLVHDSIPVKLFEHSHLIISNHILMLQEHDSFENLFFRKFLL